MPIEDDEDDVDDNEPDAGDGTETKRSVPKPATPAAAPAPVPGPQFPCESKFLQSVEEVRSLLRDFLPKSIDQALEANHGESHFLVQFWRCVLPAEHQGLSSSQHALRRSVSTEPQIIKFEFGYISPLLSTLFLSVPPCAYSPSIYERQQKSGTPLSKNKRRISIASGGGHDDDSNDERKLGIVSNSTDDDSELTAFFDHRLYSFNVIREDAGKNCREMLSNMSQRFASGSLVEIVPPTLHYTDVAALLKKHGIELPSHQANHSPQVLIVSVR